MPVGSEDAEGVSIFTPTLVKNEPPPRHPVPLGGVPHRAHFEATAKGRGPQGGNPTEQVPAWSRTAGPGTRLMRTRRARRGLDGA